MKQFYVYVYRDPSRKNEPIYVGKGQGQRAYDHIDDAQNNHLRNRLAKMKRNGIEPIINVVDMPSEALALQCEIDTIARFGRKDLKLGPVLNMTDGGEGTSGRVEGAETRKKKSDAKKGKPPPNKGKSPSLETRKKNSDAQKGKSASLETRAKMSDAHKGENNHRYGKVHPKSICPHCGKLSGPGRWHFDKCKFKS